MISITKGPWVIGIDASNIRGGGGITHLVELLRAAEPERYQIRKVVVWSGQKTLAALDDRLWLVKDHHPWLNRNLLYRVMWQWLILPHRARSAGCSLMFVPGGTDTSGFKPMVTMSQNLLPFERKEVQRYGFSLTRIKWLILRYTQTRTFRKSNGVIFLTRFARDRVLSLIGPLACPYVVVPHGVRDSFINPPRPQLSIDHYSITRPFRLIYVSAVHLYKHQWNVVEAVSILRRDGVPVELDLIGPASGPALNRLKNSISKYDPTGKFIRHWGLIPHNEIHSRYTSANLAVFASSCETFGQILIEAMSAGLPVACARRSAMPEILGEAGIYFNPEIPLEISNSIMQYIQSPKLRFEKAWAAFQRAKKYSWQLCANETFEFFEKVLSRSSDFQQHSGFESKNIA